MPGGTTARTLAPSEEAFDTPLSPPDLSDKPGSATGLSGDYPGGTCTRRSGPAFRTQHESILSGVGGGLVDPLGPIKVGPVDHNAEDTSQRDALQFLVDAMPQTRKQVIAQDRLS